MIPHGAIVVPSFVVIKLWLRFLKLVRSQRSRHRASLDEVVELLPVFQQHGM
jgi:hypothetical protein